MGKFVQENYVIYAKDLEEADNVLFEEKERINKIEKEISRLVSPDGDVMKNFKSNSDENRLHVEFNDLDSLIFGELENKLTKGEVRMMLYSNGRYTYKLAYRYPDIQGENADFRLAHEMGHLMLNPSYSKMQTYDKNTDSYKSTGLIRCDKNSNYYGIKMQENAINLLAQFAIRGKNSADDIIKGKVDLSEYNSYKQADDLIKLLAVSMRNDYDKEISFEELAQNKLDSEIELCDGKKEPANTFFYGMLNDSCIIEQEFDKYCGKGCWREIDECVNDLNNKDLDPKLFELKYKAAQDLIATFARKRMQVKYREAISRNENNIPRIDNKMKMLDEMLEQKIKTKNNENSKINELEEIIIPEKEENRKDVNNDINAEYNQKLTLKQKFIKLIQKNAILMRIPFLRGFINKQVNVLPEQNKTNNGNSNENLIHKSFIDKISNSGELKKLPQVQKMANSEKINKMKEKMNCDEIYKE